MARVRCSTIEEAVYYLTDLLSVEMRRQIGVMEREQLDLLYDVLGRTLTSHLELERNTALVNACRPHHLRRCFDELGLTILQNSSDSADARRTFQHAFADWRALRGYLDGKAPPPDTPATTPEIAAEIILHALWEHLRV